MSARKAGGNVTATGAGPARGRAAGQAVKARVPSAPDVRGSRAKNGRCTAGGLKACISAALAVALAAARQRRLCSCQTAFLLRVDGLREGQRRSRSGLPAVLCSRVSTDASTQLALSPNSGGLTMEKAAQEFFYDPLKFVPVAAQRHLSKSIRGTSRKSLINRMYTLCEVQDSNWQNSVTMY